MALGYDPPKNWEEDSLSEFMGQAIKRLFLFFVKRPDMYKKVSDIDNTFKVIIDNLNNNPDFFIWYFLCRVHGSYRAAIRLALSGQVSETYPLLRVSLENALYGFYMAVYPKSQETWLRRHDDESYLGKVKDEFKISKLWPCLKLADPKTHDIAKILYKETIDWGGHPNEKSLSQQLIHSYRTDKTWKSQFTYLYEGELPHQLSVKRTAQVGVCCLKIFRHVFRERYDLLGISEELIKLEEGL